MRLKKAKIALEIISLLLGVGAVVVAIFAYQLHIDHNQTFGIKRIALLLLGIACFILFLCLITSTQLRRLWLLPDLKGIRQIANWLGPKSGWLFMPAKEPLKPNRWSKNVFFYAVVGVFITIFIALWYITSGKLIAWAPSTIYFDRLANAFMAGKLHLLEEPPADILSIPDPYHYENRAVISDYIWDASLYHGKYYYYWGPVPAILIALVKFIHPAWIIEDQFLILFSIIGIAIIIALIFTHLKNRYFFRVPGWLITGFILLGVLNTPLFWLINHPEVHEVPIATGQFFLILGLYLALRGMESEKNRTPFFALAGFSFGAAIGCRTDLVLGIAWVVGLLCLFSAISAKKWFFAVMSIFSLIMPLLAWGGALAWYNYARFGNILETGHRFQLTGGAMPQNYQDIVSFTYLLPNLYNYLARPIEIHLKEFPFFFTPYIVESMWPRFFYPPMNYFYCEPIAGIFISMPIAWLIFLYLIKPIRRGWNWLKETPIKLGAKKEIKIDTWFVWMVFGAIICILITLSTFIFSTMRYEADLTPLVSILIFASIGWASSYFREYQRIWWLILMITGSLILISIIIGLFTNFQNGNWLFKSNNPDLYYAIGHFFTGK